MAWLIEWTGSLAFTYGVMLVRNFRNVMKILLFRMNVSRLARNFKSASRFTLVRFWNCSRDYSLNGILYSVQLLLVYTTQVNSAFRARRLASWEVISQVLFTSEQPNKNKMAFVVILSQIKLLFGPLVIQLVWYKLKQLFTSVSVKVVDSFPPLRWIIVNYF